MEKRTKIVIGIFSIILLILLITDTKPLTCNYLEKTIHTELDAAAYCENNSDCVLSNDFDCPFGCNRLINKNADLNQAKKHAASYGSFCGRCLGDCNMPPKPEEIKCKNNTCVDERLDR